ncbi:transmembrane protein 180-like isoform X2 [Styela clava]|uniref:transmembrane protein 180-like isoform X2 n=1 Tax=Styela clava TaxID=7725 RepID=UPI00193A72D4|nr:transmembrane protein 180-like isoform X2 [Styela clava]
MQKSFHVIARCYGSMALFLSLTHNVFLLYYVDMFVNVYKIDKLSFWVGEVTFLVWNSINDPLFGWLSDKHLIQKDKRAIDGVNDQLKIINKRVNSLRLYGPLFAFSFLLFWVHWLPTFLQFVVCLCLYDAFLTAVDLQHTALLADLAVQTNERNTLNRYCSIFSALGSFSVFASYAVWSQHSTLPFQIFCVAVACFSASGFFISSKILSKSLPETADFTEKDLQSIVQDTQMKNTEPKISAMKYIKQLYNNRNFRWFIAMNLLQVFHCHFNSNFFPLFMDTLVGDTVPNSICTLLIGMSFVAPHINNIYFLHLCEKFGVYNVVTLLFWIKLLLAVGMAILGPNHIWATCIFIASNRIFTEGTCKLLNLVVSDLVDEDYVLHDRPHPASALLFGMSSLLSKPGQTLAPLFGTLLLSTYTGKDIFHSDSIDAMAIGVKKSAGVDISGSSLYRDACFSILVIVPIVCACLQLLAWSRFSLRGNRLQRIKNLRICRNLECVC